MYTHFNERKLYVVQSIIVNLQYISINTTIWYMYLLQYNIYILATCFDSYESSSGINIQELLVHIVSQFFMSYSNYCRALQNQG